MLWRHGGVQVGRVRSRLAFLFVGPVANGHINWVSTSLEYSWRENFPAASNQDTPWFFFSPDCQVEWGCSQTSKLDWLLCENTQAGVFGPKY